MLDFLIIYLAQVILCCIINGTNNVRIPESIWEIIKFTFLPYVLINLTKIKRTK